MQWVFMNLQQLELINPALWCSSKFIFAVGDPNSVCLAVTWWLPFNSKSVMVHDFHWSACGVVITCLGKESFGLHWLFGGFDASAVLHLVLDSTSACTEVPVPRKRESQFDIWDMKRMKRMKPMKWSIQQFQKTKSFSCKAAGEPCGKVVSGNAARYLFLLCYEQREYKFSICLSKFCKILLTYPTYPFMLQMLQRKLHRHPQEKKQCPNSWKPQTILTSWKSWKSHIISPWPCSKIGMLCTVQIVTSSSQVSIELFLGFPLLDEFLWLCWRVNETRAELGKVRKP